MWERAASPVQPSAARRGGKDAMWVGYIVSPPPKQQPGKIIFGRLLDQPIPAAPPHPHQDSKVWKPCRAQAPFERDFRLWARPTVPTNCIGLNGLRVVTLLCTQFRPYNMFRAEHFWRSVSRCYSTIIPPVRSARRVTLCSSHQRRSSSTIFSVAQGSQ